MNLDLQMIVRVNPKALSFTIWDNTGVGDGTVFPYGWQPETGVYNTSNPKKSNAIAGTINVEYPNDGLSYVSNLTAQQILDYLDVTQGVTFVSEDIFGNDYTNLPDGIPTITITLTGTHIAAAVSAWSSYIAQPSVFLVAIQNAVRGWVVDMPVPTTDLRSVFDPAMANLILDSIYYNVQFGQITEAQASLDFLNDLINAGKNITDYINEHNL